MKTEKVILSLRDTQINNIYSIISNNDNSKLLSLNEKSITIFKFIKETIYSIYEREVKKNQSKVEEEYKNATDYIKKHYKTKVLKNLSKKDLAELENNQNTELELAKKHKKESIYILNNDLYLISESLINDDNKILLFWIDILKIRLVELLKKYSKKRTFGEKIINYIEGVKTSINNFSDEEINSAFETIIRDCLILTLPKTKSIKNDIINDAERCIKEVSADFSSIELFKNTFEIVKKENLSLKKSLIKGGIISTIITFIPIPPPLKIFSYLLSFILDSSITTKLSYDETKKIFTCFELITKIYAFALINKYEYQISLDNELLGVTT